MGNGARSTPRRADATSRRHNSWHGCLANFIPAETFKGYLPSTREIVDVFIYRYDTPKMAQGSKKNGLPKFLRANFTFSFVYPLKGIWYFASHRYLHPLAKTRIVPVILISVCVLTLLFMTAYLPLVAALAIFHIKGSAWVNATFLILEIGTLVVAVLFEGLFADHTQVDIFDAVMIAEGYEHLVRTKRPVSEDIDESDPARRLGARDKGAIYAPFSFRQIFEFVFLLPLNLVPFVGVPLFLLATGYRAGPLLSWRYFVLKGFTKKERKEFIATKKHRWEYMWFGVVYMILQLIPVLSLLFLLTSAAGSALWAVRLERDRTDRLPINEDEELPPEYTDEP